MQSVCVVTILSCISHSKYTHMPPITWASARPQRSLKVGSEGLDSVSRNANPPTANFEHAPDRSKAQPSTGSRCFGPVRSREPAVELVGLRNSYIGTDSRSCVYREFDSRSARRMNGVSS
jgi:hypothetical protein